MKSNVDISEIIKTTVEKWLKSMKKIKVVIGVGCGLHKDGRFMSFGFREVKLERATRYLLETYGAYAVTEVQGGWRDETGKDWIEPGYTFSVTVEAHHLAVHPAAASAVVIRDLFDQQCVVLETSEVNFELI